MRIKNNIILYLLNLSLAVSILFSCSFRDGIADYSEIRGLMSSAIKDSVFPGAVLLFGNNNEIIFHEAFGHFTYDTISERISKSSIFDLASVSKVIGTTSAAMLLVQNDKLSIDDRVIDYLPEFDNNGKDQITIRNLLLHNSGMPAFKRYYDVYESEAEVINDIMNLKPEYQAGEKYIYSDLGMITLQKVIEKISSLPMNIYLEENLFNKLEMHNTLYDPPAEIKSNCVPTEIDDYWRMRLIQGEVHDERAFMLNGVAGHAGLFSTASDLAKFSQMMLNDGYYKGVNIIDKNIIDEWISRQTDQSDRALGWDTKSEIILKRL
ncbi:MAG: serine hydrolase, partial [Melioribacteraceae bacterium]|nr:serine hydrolase [Melioribacteraceae bacterium]